MGHGAWDVWCVGCTHQLNSQGGLVIHWQMFLQAQHDAVGDDGEKYHILERREVR